MKYALILLFIIIITQIVLVIVAAYFIFRIYSCVYTTSAAFTQFTCASIWIASWFATAVYKLKQVIRSNMWKETCRYYFIFRCSWNVKNIRECHQHPTHRLFTSRGAIQHTSKEGLGKKILFCKFVQREFLETFSDISPRPILDNNDTFCILE